jgi:hypothetical protein
MRTGLFAFAIVTALPALASAQPADQWLFDESSGYVAHNSVAGRTDGTLSAGASFMPGVAGNAVFLPPWEQVSFGSSGDIGTSDFTVRFWLKTSGDGIGNGWSTFAEVFGNRGGYGSCGSYFDFRMGRAGWIGIEISENEGCWGYTGAGSNPAGGVVNDGNWHLITAIRQGPTVSLYVDGALRGSGTNGDGHTAYIDSPFNTAAGANENSFIYDLPFNGFIDGLEIYDHALTPFELATPTEKLAIVKSTVAGYGLPSGIATALTAKLDAAIADLASGDTATAQSVLNAFINQCNAQRGKKLTAAQADALIALASATIASL